MGWEGVRGLSFGGPKEAFDFILVVRRQRMLGGSKDRFEGIAKVTESDDVLAAWLVAEEA